MEFYNPLEPTPQNKQKLTEKNWFVILLLILLWPVGLFFMWKNRVFSKTVRIIISSVLILLLIIGFAMSKDVSTATKPMEQPAPATSTTTKPKPAPQPEQKPAPEPQPAPEPEPAPTPQPEVPREYRSALEKAKNYSKLMHMSKQGIYDQLVSEYGENFSPEAAQYAIDHLEANYFENAVKKANSYQETLNMSPNAIYDQLISEYGEKFTEEEAAYAIEHMDQ
jgi:type IV secretory pathway VirB10-like protein